MKIFEIISEATDSQVYSIGDSHAEGLSYTKGIINYAHGGQPSTSATNYSGSYNGHPTGVENVPKGARIVIAQGCNDAANSSRAFQDSKGKIPLVPPETIASNVAKLVSAAKNKSDNVVFVLFPNGDPKIKPYYGGEYQEKVRKAIKSAVGLPVIDMEGSALADGVHAVPGAYKEAGAKALTMLGKGAPTTDKDNKKQGDAPQGTTTGNDKFEIGVPAGRSGLEVADVQKALVALGFDIGPRGIDGVRGPYTSAAVKKLQSQLGVAVDGDPGPETVGALNKLLASKPEIASKLTHATRADVKTSDYSAGANEFGKFATDENGDKAKAVSEKFLGRSLADQEWNYLVRGIYAESTSNQNELAHVAAVILNRTRSGKWGNSVVSVLRAPNQFQSVTGTRADGHSASRNFTQGPSGGPLGNIYKGLLDNLPSCPKDIYRFTAANRKAYGAGTNVGYLDQLLAQGGQQIGGTVFA
jgi:hypothetical protein